MRIKVPEENFVRYNPDDLRVLGRIVSILQKEAGWKWKHYNVRMEDSYEILFEAEGVQPQVVTIFMALAHGHPLEPIFEKVAQSLVDEIAAEGTT